MMTLILITIYFLCSFFAEGKIKIKIVEKKNQLFDHFDVFAPSRSVLEGLERYRQAAVCGGSRASPGPAPPGPPELQVQASPQEDHQETQAGRAGASAPQPVPRRGVRHWIRTWCQSLGCRRHLWGCLWTSKRAPHPPPPLSPPAALSWALQGPPGPRTPRAGELRPAHSGDVASGYFGRWSWGICVFPPTYARGGWDGGLEWVPPPPTPPQPALRP